MDGTGPQHPLSDSQLDRDLEAALGVEPSPEFLARVRTRVAAEPERALWRQALWGRGAQPVVVMALVSVLLAVVVPNVMKNVKRSEPDVTVARHVDVSTRERVEALTPAAREQVVVPVARPVEADVYVGLSKESDAVHTLPLRLSQPLFSADESRALLQLVAGVEEGRLPPVVAETAPAAAAQPDVRTALNIEPLVIDPLPLLALVPKEGEGQW